MQQCPECNDQPAHVQYDCPNCGVKDLCWNCVYFYKEHYFCPTCHEAYEPSYLDDKKQLKTCIKHLLKCIHNAHSVNMVYINSEMPEEIETSAKRIIDLKNLLRELVDVYFNFKKHQENRENSRQIFIKLYQKM